MLRVKANFSGTYPDKLCSFGCSTEEIQEHKLNCIHLKQGLEDPSILAEIKYDDIFGSLKSQTLFIQPYCELLKVRDKLKESCRLHENPSPVDEPHSLHAAIDVLL